MVKTLVVFLRKKRLPSVEFDAGQVTKPVRDAIKRLIISLPDIPAAHHRAVYMAAQISIARGRDLALLSGAIIDLDIAGMSKARASRIARDINNHATSLMHSIRLQSLGIVEAEWLWSGASCDLPEADEHRSANGKRYTLDVGLIIAGIPTFPGSRSGCKCVSKAVIPGFD